MFRFKLLFFEVKRIVIFILFEIIKKYKDNNIFYFKILYYLF